MTNKVIAMIRNSPAPRLRKVLPIWLVLIIALFSINPVFADAASDKEKVLEKELLYPLLLNDICEEYLPGFNDRARKSFITWRKQYEPAVSKAIQKKASDPGVAKELAREKEKIKRKAHAGSNPDDVSIADECRMQVIRMESAIPPNDSRFNTPKKTGELYIESLAKGDRFMAQQCLGENAIFTAVAFEKETKDALSKSVSEVVSVVIPEYPAGEKKVEGYFLTKRGRSPVIFELEQGNWRIINAW